MKHLLTVKDTFLIQGRGLVVVPAPPVELVRGPGDVEVELRLPAGPCRLALLTLLHEFVNPPPSVRRWGCMFRSLDKMDVPIGTEIWCAEEVFLAPSGLGGAV